MPPLPVINRVHRVTLNITSSTRPAVHNTFHVRTDVLAPPSEVGAALDTALADASVDNLIVPLPDDYSITSASILPLDGVTASAVETESASWPVGLQQGDVVPEAAVIVSLRTLLRGPAGRGRLFIGPLTESVLSNGNVASNVPGLLSAAWSSFFNVLSAQPNIEAPVVASYKHSTAAVVTGVDVKTFIGTQRRRLVRLR